MLLTLINKKQESSDCISFVFKPKEHFSWQSGQYLRYYIDNPNPDQRGTGRFFTIASAPFEGVVMLTTRFAKEKGSSFKNDLGDLSLGTQIEATGPHGQFIIEDTDKSYVFLAGGIGITPFRSILLDLDHKGQRLNITLLYANRNEEIVYRKELEDLQSKHPEFKIHYFTGENRLDGQKIKNSLDYELLTLNPLFYVSGPKLMVEAIDQMLEDLGVSKAQIKNDLFPGYN